MIGQTPQFKTLSLPYKGKLFQIEYFYRPGNGETILLVHGLGGAKENYLEACKSSALSKNTLIAFDNPGTGNSNYYDDLLLNVDDLSTITALFVNELNLNNFILCGTSMGGLTTLLYLRGLHSVKAYINIEGNLLPEDCMFSSKVIGYDFEHFEREIFPETILKMKENGNTGYHIIANNLQLNTHCRSYHNYSFQTVKYSSTGELLKQFLEMKIPKIFIYGDANRTLSYLLQLRKSDVEVREISDSDHFIFYDNPKALYDEIGSFLDQLRG